MRRTQTVRLVQSSNEPFSHNIDMGAYYDEIEIEDMAWDEAKGVYHYPCPCGDRFEISRKQLANYEDIATCPSCSLIIRVVYDPVRYLNLLQRGVQTRAAA
jgi:diphthamide biosynthesis protein 3